MRTNYLLVIVMLCAALPARAGEVFVHVLGVAQDAGLPQALCYEPHCLRAWKDPQHRRMATSIAVVDRAGRKKYLFDATPDMREQLFELHRVAPDGEYDFGGVFLTHAHIGHYAGLMHLGHEAAGAHQVPVYAMPRMREYLATNGPWDQLLRYDNISLRPLEHDQPVQLGNNLVVTPFRVPHRDEYSETVGFRIDGPRRSAVFIPDIDKWQDWAVDVRKVVASVDYALLDATFFRDGELQGRDMSRVRHPYVTESMSLLASLSKKQKGRVIFIHMNHTNPLLVNGSPEQLEVERRGFRYALEGMRLDL